MALVPGDLGSRLWKISPYFWKRKYNIENTNPLLKREMALIKRKLRNKSLGFKKHFV